MRNNLLRTTDAPGEANQRRLGSIILLAAGMMVMVFGFLAFSVDVGYITLTKGQLETASDAGAKGATMELADGLGTGATKTDEEAKAAAIQAAVAIAAANRAGEQSSVYADPARDVRVGNVVWDPVAGAWNKQWGVAPYNMVELTLHRDQVGGTGNNGDGPLPLFFAPVIGHTEAELSTRGIAALLPGKTLRIPPGSNQTIAILPFALDIETWDALINENVGEGDNFTVNPDTGAVTSGGDGIKEVNLYPHGNDELPPGNRGTVDIGSPNNSTSDLSRQILYGQNAFDFSYFPNSEVTASPEEPLTLNGDTGISAGCKDELETIKGQIRLIPIFTNVQGNGNNANYTIVKFVGVRVVEVKMTGNPKRVMVQPTPYVSPAVQPDYSGDPIVGDTIFTLPALIN